MRSTIRTRRATGALVLMLFLPAPSARAQELEPRVYLATPVGSNVIVVAVGRSTGDVIFDPTVPIEDARARVGVLAFAYYRSFDLFGRSASLGATFPLLRGSAQGLRAGRPERADRLGQGDLAVRLTANLFGSPAMDTPTFAKRGRHVELGASVIVQVLTGQYDNTRLINLGTNRWAVKPEVGVTIPIGERWLLDTYAGVWLFADNPDFLGDRRSQDPLATTQVHLSYNLSRRAWLAGDVTFYSGGRTVVDGMAQVERLNNTRIGATLSVPVAARQSLRFAASSGAWVRLGSDFTTLSVAWSYAWGRGF